METEPTQAAGVETEAEEIKGSVWRLQGIFFDPRATFRDIRRKPTFLVALVLCMAVALAGAAVIYSRVDMSQIMEQQIRSSGAGQQMTDEQIREQVRTISQSPIVGVMAWLGPVAGAPFLIFIVSSLLILMVYLAGTETSFKKLLGVTAYTYFLYYVVSTVLVTVVFLVATDPRTIDIQNPIASNLGHLVDAGQSPVLHRLASSFDLITFYVLYLLGLGTATVSGKMKVGTGIGLVGTLYGLYVLLAIGWRAIFG
jgi:hypothetical protein